MPKKSPSTPTFRITSKLTMMFTQSRERAAAVKRTGNCCERCGVKGSRAKGREVKIHVHHKTPIDMKKLVDTVRRLLLVSPDELEVLCRDCHVKHHSEGEDNGNE